MDLRTSGNGLEVPLPTAGAGLALRTGHGHMSDLAGHVVCAPAGSSLDDEGAADPGAHGHHEDDLGPGAGAEPGLTGGIGIDVVLDMDRQHAQPCSGKSLPHTGGDLRAGPAGDGIGGGQDRPALDVNDTGGPDANRNDRHGPTRILVRSCRGDFLHQSADGIEHGVRAVVGRGWTGGHRTLQGAIDVHQSGSHLGAAKIEADDERGLSGR